MDFHALSPFGVEINSVSITALQDADIDPLKHALAANGFVVFRQQSANDADFVRFLDRLGHLTFTIGETPVSHQPNLNIVSNIGRTTPPRSVFHTDTSYIAHPPAYTALRAVTIPTAGGGTLFSDQYRAYDTLPRSVTAQLADAQVLHVVSGLTLPEGETQSWHPLFQRHPLSGRLALFLSTPARCQAISGIAPAQAGRIIRLLYQHSIRPYRWYRHQWQPDDIIVWDNRCTMHRADHSAVIGDRVLHRGLVLSR
ncbi:TauD/TfdA dioxygenase family protein [Chamaesiphon sp.]|uniref:TauD/TfdA dioxygenase family protein n=1 Tax=Chamaesiphon sp. TaxID=2814140 RepID=UPI003594164D